MTGPVMYCPVREFSPIRIVCNHNDCGAVTELHVIRVEAVMKKTGACCPVCGKPFTRPDIENGADAITLLAKALQAIAALGPQVRVEVPMPVVSQ